MQQVKVVSITVKPLLSEPFPPELTINNQRLLCTLIKLHVVKEAIHSSGSLPFITNLNLFVNAKKKFEDAIQLISLRRTSNSNKAKTHTSRGIRNLPTLLHLYPKNDLLYVTRTVQTFYPVQIKK